MIGRNTIALMTGVVAVVALGAAQADCKRVRGRVTSDLVATFADGGACPSPLGLCTEGRYTGPLKGRFVFVANTLTPFAAFDPGAASDVAATTGVIHLQTGFCDGTIAFLDAASFSLGGDGFFASLSTADPSASIGGCAGASGRLRLAGVFDEGCVDCEYEGEICGVGPSRRPN